MAVLHTVMGSGRPVIFEDAAPVTRSPLSTGPATAQARSIAGLPLVKQGRLVGVLYLENRLLPAVFTADRMRLLELLAPQAAISLENARLYAQVLDQDARRRRSEAALGAARAELAQTAHLTAMGGLAASIGHEINQPLQSIISNVAASLRWMGREPPDLVEVRTNLQDIDRSAQRAGSIVKGLRALARKEPLAKAPVRIDAIVREVLALVDNEITARGVRLAATLCAERTTVMADPVQLQQVVLNLLTNALDAVRQTPSPAVKVRSMVRGDRIIVAVEDNGPGVAPQVRERMFAPLFTTKSSGMGMGLAICRSIIEAHGGRLDLAAPEGQGARLEFDLPVVTP
jgi:C4-dicarboxylate-specific signal transduction histidine kinase